MKKHLLLLSILLIGLYFNSYAAVNLIISGGVVPNSMYRNQTYPVTIYVQNTGTTSTSTSFYVNVSISSNSIYDGTQTWLKDIFVSGGIAANSTITLNTTITIPCSYSIGTRYILVASDATNTVYESDDTDNSLPFGILLHTAVDFAPSNYSLSSSSVNSGSSITSYFGVNNSGGTASGSFSIGFYLSTSSTLTLSQATYLGGYSISSLAACSQVNSLSTSLTIPSLTCSGNYWLFIWVDDGLVISEFDDSNNFQSQTLYVNGVGSQIAPTAMSPTSITETSFIANWYSASGATGYYVDVATDNSFSNLVFSNYAVGSSTTHNFTGLTCNTNYYYRVRASNGCGSSINSSTVSLTTSACCAPPSAPTASSATSITETSFIANWYSASGATGYYVDVATDNSFSNLVFSNYAVGNFTSYNFTGLICNTSYYYRVLASNGCGTSGNSTTVSLITSACCTPPSAPTAISPTNITETSFTANWYSASGATDYYVDVATDISFSNLVFGNYAVGNFTSYNFTGLICNTGYYYRVRASNGCGSSGNSSAVSLGTSSCVDPSLAIPLQIISPVGTPSGISGCTCIIQSHYSISPRICQAPPTSGLYGWQYWQRADCTMPPHHDLCTGIGINGQCDTKADDRMAWDCNMNSPQYNLDREQNVYAIDDGYIMTGDDFVGWSPTTSCSSCGLSAGQLLIRHDNGGKIWYSGYLHLEQITSKKFESNLTNRHVYDGEVIGVVGKTGADNYHLHFAVYYLDPVISTKLHSVDRTVVPRLIPSTAFRLNLVGSIVSGAFINIKRDSIWKEYGTTDENGNAQILLIPEIHQGDSLQIISSGYEEMKLPLDTNIISNKKLIVPLLEQLVQTQKIQYAKVIALDKKSVYSTPLVNLKVTARNIYSYDVYRIAEFGDSVAYLPVFLNLPYQDSMININMVDTGVNNFNFLFKGLDSISLTKSFNYDPNYQNTYNVLFSVPYQFIGAELSVDGFFVKRLLSNYDSLSLINGTHYLTVQSYGYRDTTLIINSNGIVNVFLDSIKYSLDSDSLFIDFSVSGKVYFKKNITVLDSLMQNVISIRQFDSDFSFFGLIPKSRKFEVQHLNVQWSGIRFVAALDQVERISTDSTYLMKIYDDTSFTKILFDASGGTATYDSAVQKLTYNYINFNNGTASKEALVIMKKQAPITNALHSINMNENDTLSISMWQFFSDPDSIHNDMTVSLINSASQLNVQGNGDSLLIIPTKCWAGSGNLILEATHDGLTRSIVVSINVMAPARPTIAAAGDTTFCYGSSVSLISSPGMSYFWSNSETSETILVTQSGNYYVVVTDVNNCSDTSRALLVTVNSLPLITINPSSNNVCQGESITLSGSGASFYTWSNGVVDGVPFYPAVSATYTVTGTDFNGCQDTATVLLSVNSLPIVSATATPDTVCFGSNTILTGAGANNYSWTNGVTNGIAFIPSITTTYTVTGTDTNNCQNYSIITVVVNQLPNVDAGDNIVILQGDSTIIGGAPTATGNGPFAYVWIPSTSLDSINIANPTATPHDTITYVVIVTDVNGCVGIDSMSVIVNTPTAILESSNLQGMVIFPNPTHDVINVAGDKIENGEYFIALRNVLGQVMFSGKLVVFNHTVLKQISISNIPDGIYLLIINKGMSRAMTRLHKM